MACRSRTGFLGLRTPFRHTLSTASVGRCSTYSTIFVVPTIQKYRNRISRCCNAVEIQGLRVASRTSNTHKCLQGITSKRSSTRSRSSFETHIQPSWRYLSSSWHTHKCFASEEGKINVDDSGNLKLLAQLQALPVGKLHEVCIDGSGCLERAVAISFISWIADKASKTTDPEEAEVLESLCGRLLVLRDTMEGAVEQLGKLPVETSTLIPSAGLAMSPVDCSTSFSQLACAADLAAVKMETELELSRRESITAVMGRVAVTAEQMESISSIMAEERILDVLMEIYDPEQLRSVLDDALTPPSPEQQNANPDKEFVFTTPYRLVQAIDKRLTGNSDMEPVAKQQLHTLREFALEQYEII